MDGIPVRDMEKCLYCYHCAVVCPSKAVICPTERVADMVKTNVKILGWEQPKNAIFL
jgi:Fe-S-cluster-containing hydrogenase component 2